ncbi:MAG: sulfide/dihydroorotate dehydrogenase-like FAD/NAD-binding protein [Acholeplasmataceae bacterium]|nr:sulfide/dihydroorotate dehydrogenase-like FAD/NAD-binding protein [Acholeplasmataceae bacterium]
MYIIKEKKNLTETTTMMVIDAPHIVKHAKVGQFVMVRALDTSERIPLTIADKDKSKGFITIIFQVVGASTYELNQLNENDSIQDIVGPLGKPSELEGLERVLLIGGGVGCAILYPIAEQLRFQHAEIMTIIGFRTQSQIFLESEFINVSSRFSITTDDGSYGEKGRVTDLMIKLLEEDHAFDKVIAIGPIVMMKAVTEVAKRYHLPITVSMNPIMVDGTGMCGGCRVSVGGQMMFACVDGPEFDGMLVDYDMAIKRNQLYQKEENEAYQKMMMKEEDMR